MRFSVHVFMNGRRGANLTIDADDSASAAVEAYRRSARTVVERPFVRYDASRSAWYVEGIPMWVSERSA